jgi:D-sedoheptulose 7-phosphate isomerase
MNYINELVERYPLLDKNKNDIMMVCETLENCFESGGKLMICGNGGSCADAEHITGELMKGFLKKREISAEQKAQMKGICPEIDSVLLESLQKGLPVIPLDGCSALNTAFANDCNPEFIYAQQVLGYAKTGDVFLGISTSGNAKNVYDAACVAKALGLFTVALSGKDGGKLKGISDISIVVDENETFKIQELHLPVYHAICATVEEYFFKS